MSLRKLKNSRTGAVVRVDERTATRLGAEWIADRQDTPAVDAEVTDRVDTGAETDANAEASESVEDTPAVDAERPSKNASRAEWAEYATTLGLDAGTCGGR